jgi:hypothetical protein
MLFIRFIMNIKLISKMSLVGEDIRARMPSSMTH